MIQLRLSISHTRWFDTQREVAEFLNIKNSSKKAIATRCKVLSFGIQFYDYYGKYNIEL